MQTIGSLTLETLSVEQAAAICRCSKTQIFQLINDKSETKFPGAKISSKSFVVDAAGLAKWIKNGGLVGVKSEIDVKRKLTGS